MMPLTSEDYVSVYWSQLREAIDMMLNNAPGSYKPISYEQMYSAVYKCVCKQYSEQLYGDLMLHMAGQLQRWTQHLNEVADQHFVDEFHKAISQFFHALTSIVPIFTYMNRFYIEGKLHTDLRTELMKLFAEHVSNALVPRLLPLLEEANHQPFRVAPNVMQAIVQNLHSLDPAYAQLAPDLFSRHLIGITAPMSEDDLEAQREADRRLQEELRRAGFDSGDRSKKRVNDQDPITSR